MVGEEILPLYNSLPGALQLLMRFIFSEAFVKAVIFPGAIFSTLLGLFALWYERKLLARIMLRVGPLHVGKVSGILQTLADGLKLLSKERIVPENANKALFVLMPATVLILSLLLYAFLPFSPSWIIFPSEIGLLLFFAVSALTPVPLLVAGYASGSKYPLIGTTRLALMLFGYEIPMFIALTGVVLMSGSFNLVKIVEAQSAVPFIIPQIIGFIVFFTTVLAEAERVPFDIPTAEGEIVSGWGTEYSGAYFLMIYLALYEKLIALSVLTSLLYLGGWHGPPIPGLPESIYAPFWLMIKTFLVLTVIFMFRAIFPRFTIEKVLDLGWKYLIPLGFLNLFIVILFVEFL
ncbi:MAG: NADH-quinone oxidoreductase subunit NuoH [Aigarchaeota archaeon]|nr:NADH-quinone oxidoreductase subunit NuoH [Aigarchaeota archaeon]MDW8092152.1 NADH-quinone oxidoreductase subunit NuoH [Nitrososphaerota archaeon]